MLYPHKINDHAWSKLYEYLSNYPKIHTNNKEKTRYFVEAVFWIAKSGAQWRLLPKEYGDWNAVYHRFADWAEHGVWYKMLYYFSNDPDMEYIMIDSTVLRAHACAAGANKKNRRSRRAGLRSVLRRFYD